MSRRVIEDKNGITRVITGEHKRKRIIEENLIQYIDIVDMSDRNKGIVRMCAAGASLTAIAEAYGISSARVSQILFRYIQHTNKKRGLFD